VALKNIDSRKGDVEQLVDIWDFREAVWDHKMAGLVPNSPLDLRLKNEDEIG
jgi:hypothetical protein